MIQVTFSLQGGLVKEPSYVQKSRSIGSGKRQLGLKAVEIVTCLPVNGTDIVQKLTHDPGSLAGSGVDFILFSGWQCRCAVSF